MILALCAALWVAKSKVYPDADDAGEFTDVQLKGEADASGRPTGKKKSIVKRLFGWITG